MSIIKAQNPTTFGVPKTYLAISQASGVGTAYVKNVNGFQANWAIQIGDQGQDQTEVVLLGAGAP